MSNEAEYERKLDAELADLDRQNKAARRRNLIMVATIVLAVLLAVVCAWLAFDRDRLAVENAQYGAEQAKQKQSLAQEASDVLCQSATKTAALSETCKTLEKAASEPTEGPRGLQGVPGIQGVQGPPGRDGVPGLPGAVGPSGQPGTPGQQGVQGIAGLAGIAGLNGAAGAAGMAGAPGLPGATGPQGPPGPAGPPGKDGADSTVAGPPGPAGANGAPGPAGPQGEQGRGIQNAMCGDDGRWVITYTDGATSDGGTCRTQVIPPGANP